jgi:hypothetical protein
MLAKNPGFTEVAVLTLAPGIGANTAILSLLNAVMLGELPVHDPGRLFLFGRGRARRSTDDFARTRVYSYSFYRENQVFADASALLSVLFGGMHGAMGGNRSLEPMNGQLVSGTYFATLGVKPVLGAPSPRPRASPPGAILSRS